jgi:hypothetical protein
VIGGAVKSLVRMHGCWTGGTYLLCASQACGTAVGQLDRVRLRRKPERMEKLIAQKPSTHRCDFAGLRLARMHGCWTEGRTWGKLFSSQAHGAPVAQLDRASGYEPEGREFESPRAHHFTKKNDVSGAERIVVLVLVLPSFYLFCEVSFFDNGECCAFYLFYSEH